MTNDENSPLVSFSDHTLMKSIITNFTITKSMQSFDGTNFDNVKTLARIYIASGNSDLIVEDNVIFNKNKVNLIYSASCRYGNYTVPDGVQRILTCGFHFSKLTRIILPNTLKTIDGYTFIGSNIIEIEIPSSCTSIGQAAFS